MYIDTEKVLPDELMESAWRLYCAAFDELRVQAVQRHVMHRAEFDEVMLDDRVLKYVSHRGAEVYGLGTVTNDLDAVPLISPDYFRHRWPDLYAERRIHYLGFMAVQSGRSGVGLFVRMLREMYQPVGASNGVVVMDICSFNEREYQMPAAVAKATRRVSGEVRLTRMDSQSYWLYEFPEAS